MRIVSLCPSLTELVFDLGRGQDLVGRTRFCVHPAGVDAVERVGGTKNPKVDRIIELAPDLVLMNEEENRSEDAEALKGAGLRVVSSMPASVGETVAMVRDIGAILAVDAEGERIAQAIEQEAERVARAAGDAAPVRYAYLIWWEPLMVAGEGTYIDGLLSAAGGVNAFGGPDRYRSIAAAELSADGLDAVLLSSEPFPFADRHAERIAEATGMPRERIRFVDGELLSWHGSRTVAGLRYAGELMASLRGG